MTADNIAMTNQDHSTMHAQQFSVAATGLAQHYATTGDAWAAIHTQTLAYVSAADWLMRLCQTPDRSERLTTIADNIEKFTPPEYLADIGDILNPVLKAIIDGLPVSLMADFFTIVVPPRDIEADPADLSPILHRTTMHSWNQQGLPEAIYHHRLTQVNTLIEAKALFADGQNEEATLLVHNADVAAFYAWLMEHSLAMGDTDLVMARIRWDMFVEMLTHLDYLPTQAQESINLVRSRMAWALGPANTSGFAETIPEL